MLKNTGRNMLKSSLICLFLLVIPVLVMAEQKQVKSPVNLNQTSRIYDKYSRQVGRTSNGRLYDSKNRVIATQRGNTVYDSKNRPIYRIK